MKYMFASIYKLVWSYDPKYVCKCTKISMELCSDHFLHLAFSNQGVLSKGPIVWPDGTRPPLKVCLQV
jgi:hypothetical protein